MRALGCNMMVLFCIGCAGSARAPVSKVRFANAPAVWLVNDRKAVEVQPAKRPDVGTLRGFDIAVTDPIDMMLSPTNTTRALNTNSFDEVPTSTWFVNRIGVREVSLEEMARGPNKTTGPDLSSPLRVTRGKEAGMMPGFIVQDAAGVRWLIKFDPAGVAMDAADVASQRLLWAAGAVSFTACEPRVSSDRLAQELAPVGASDPYFLGWPGRRAGVSAVHLERWPR